MKKNTSTIFVTCALDGQDKLLVQSILGEDNDYGDYCFKYTEQKDKESVFISKRKDDWNEEYYAVIKNSHSTIPIKSSFDRESLKTLLTYISEIISDQKAYQQKSSVSKKGQASASDPTQVKKISVLSKLSPLVSDLYESLKDKKITTIQIKGNVPSLYQKQGFHCLLDMKNGVIYSNVSINEYFCRSLVESDSSSFAIEPNGKIEMAVNLKYSSSIKVFLWHLGILSHQKLIDQRYVFSDDVIKHLQWPDYGCLPYQKEFLKLNVIITNHQLSYSQLVLQSRVTQSIINQFLNANLLLGYLTFVNHKGEALSHIRSTKSDFLKSVKSYFSKSFTTFWSKR